VPSLLAIYLRDARSQGAPGDAPVFGRRPPSLRTARRRLNAAYRRRFVIPVFIGIVTAELLCGRYLSDTSVVGPALVVIWVVVLAWVLVKDVKRSSVNQR
jgi:hypothetical protein